MFLVTKTEAIYTTKQLIICVFHVFDSIGYLFLPVPESFEHRMERIIAFHIYLTFTEEVQISGSSVTTRLVYSGSLNFSTSEIDGHIYISVGAH